MKYIKALDGLRALAIILVMLFHFYFLLEVGWIGVQLFFVLSGYLITSILLTSKTDQLGDYLKRFYWRRSLRIFPLYYIYLLAITGLYFVAHIPEDYISKIPYLALYNYNHYPVFESLSHDVAFTHFWSLSVEEQFYLFWPFIIFFLNIRSLKILVIGIIVIVPIFRYGVYEWLITHDYPLADLGQIIYRLTPAQIDSFAFGAAIPIFSLTDNEKLGRTAGFISALLFIGFGVLNLITTESPISSLGYVNGGTANYQYVWSYTLINAASLGLILVILSNRTGNIVRNIFENKILVQIGKVSYGMYVYHWVFLAFYRKTIHPFIGYRPLSFIVYMLMVYIISWLSFRIFESYFINLKDRFVGKAKSLK